MQVTRVSALTGIERTREICVLPEELKAWQNGVAIQRAMPRLTPEQREFMISGITEEEWEEMYGEDE